MALYKCDLREVLLSSNTVQLSCRLEQEYQAEQPQPKKIKNYNGLFL